MPKLLRSLICLRVITDRDSNTASYIDAVESFALPRLPHPFPPLFVVTVWRREKDGDRLQARLRVLSPTGKELKSIDINQELQAEIHRHNVGLGGFNLEEEGEYRVAIEQISGEKWVALTPLILTVSLIQSAQAKTGAASAS